MRAYFYQCGIWTGTDSLWHGLGLNGRIKQARSGKGPGPFYRYLLQERAAGDIHYPETSLGGCGTGT